MQSLKIIVKKKWVWISQNEMKDNKASPAVFSNEKK